MCGIAGFYNTRDSSLGQKSLDDMNNALAHRGPDSKNTYLNNTVGLAHRRLSIVDLSENGNQPMTSANKRYVMVYNGEVYNYRELSKKYLPNFTLKSHTDTEVIVELYALLGSVAFDKMNGMFAGAIYDVQEDTLLLFRDKWGKKPLFYYQSQNFIVFASEIKALKTIPQIKFEINKEVISQFMHVNFIKEPFTIYTNIYKLVAGNTLKISTKNLSEKLYITHCAEENNENYTWTESKKKVHNLLISAVETRMMSDVPFGALLSGGVDSSLICAIAQKLSPVKLKTFTIGFNETKFDESPYARNISNFLNTDHFELKLGIDDAMELMDSIFSVYDEPFADTSALPTMLVSKMVSQHVKMVITGDGGDELFMGYGTNIWAQRLSNPLVKLLRKPAALILEQIGGSYQKAGHIMNYTSKYSIQSHIFSQEQGFFSEEELQNLLTDNYKPFQFDFEIENNRKYSEVEKQSLWDIKYYLREDLLVKIDRASMLHSLEMRSPFLDNSLANYAQYLPEKYKLNNGVGKYILKEILKDYLPNQFFDRPKKGFSIPLSKWLRKELRTMLDIYAGDDITQNMGIFDPKIVAKIRKSYLEGNDFLCQRLWLIICMHKWLKINQLSGL